MGEMADYLINGDDCQVCGVPFDEPGDGYPRTCEGCKREAMQQKKPKAGKVAGK